jgi:hypothetical protein
MRKVTASPKRGSVVCTDAQADLLQQIDTVPITVPWTYELPLPDAGSEGLEDYEAQASSGEDIGRVAALLEHDGDVYVAVECSRMPPLTHHLHVFPWAEVAEVDHADLRVGLRVPHERIEEVGFELDPKKAVHGSGADAVRITELPPGLTHAVRAGSPGPVERASLPAAIFFWLLGSLTLLAVVVLISIDFEPWKFVFLLVPVAHWAVALALTGYRLYREPYGRHAGTPR